MDEFQPSVPSFISKVRRLVTESTLCFGVIRKKKVFRSLVYMCKTINQA